MKQRLILNKAMSAEIKKAIVQILGVGEDNAKNNRELREALAQQGYKVGESELRKLIEDLRESPIAEGIILANTTDGYFYEKDAAQVVAYIETLRNRAAQIFQTMNSIKRQYESKYNRSASLFLQPSDVVAELKEMGLSFHGEGHYWHPRAKCYIKYTAGRIGHVGGVYAKTFSQEFYSMEEVKAFIEERIK